MPDGFPKTKLSEGSGWSKITFSFTGTKVMYDPIAEVGDDVVVDVEETSTGASLTASVVVVFFVMILNMI